MLGLARALRARGILGLNKRNGDYIARYNSRRLYPLVDDKLLTKSLALEAGMAVPELYGVTTAQHEISQLPSLLTGHEDFVLKPARGSGGNGILVITGTLEGRYRRPGGQLLREEELGHHVSGILSGLYSLGGQRDRAMLEYRVRFDPLFEQVTFQGVPDIRVIVFLGHPAMAMVRLPTRYSDGKANLHQGAIGAGIDLATGRTLAGVLGNDVVRAHPDTGQSIRGLEIPGWQTILELAARCFEITGLGYLGVDIVLDDERGPLILELNARPGLNIQIANGQGLRSRLERIAAETDPDAPTGTRVAFSRASFRHQGGA